MSKTRKDRKDTNPIGKKLANAMARSKANKGGPHRSIEERIDRRDRKDTVKDGIDYYLTGQYRD